MQLLNYKKTNKMVIIEPGENFSENQLHPLRAMESRRRGRVVPGSLRAGCFSAGKI